MRLIGHLETESAARTFGDYLHVRGIANHLESQQAEGWGIWVKDEDKLAEAGKLLAAFRANPTDPEFQTQARDAARLRAEQEKEQEAYRKRLRDRRDLFRPLTAYGLGPLTLALILASVIVFFLSKFGDNQEAVMGLFITKFRDEGDMIRWLRNLPEIRHGQIWRLFTPIFIHFTVLHIFFNMLWLRDLGSMIEGRQTSGHLAALVLVIAACSNLAQYYFGHGPNFGGMSGVIYGLLGYVWVRGRFDPASGLFVHQTTVIMMIAWFFICWVGVLQFSVANYTHTAGLILGMAWGYLSSLRYR